MSPPVQRVVRLFRCAHCRAPRFDRCDMRKRSRWPVGARTWCGACQGRGNGSGSPQRGRGRLLDVVGLGDRRRLIRKGQVTAYGACAGDLGAPPYTPPTEQYGPPCASPQYPMLSLRLEESRCAPVGPMRGPRRCGSLVPSLESPLPCTWCAVFVTTSGHGSLTRRAALPRRVHEQESCRPLLDQHRTTPCDRRRRQLSDRPA